MNEADGFPYRIHAHIISVRIEPHYQFEKAAGIFYQPLYLKTKKLPLTMWVYGSRKIIVWPGIVYPEVNRVISVVIRDSDQGHARTVVTWPAYDPRYFQRAIDSVIEDPLINMTSAVQIKHHQQELFFVSE